MAAGASNLPAESPEGATSVAAPLCHNCGAVALGNYCSQCGQTTHVHMPSLFEFLHEFVSHHVAFEGTLVASLKRLLFAPGRLTLDYFEGRRARYVAPLRLYLTFNVIFFLAIEVFQTVGLGHISQDVDARRAVAQAKFSDATAAISEATAEIMADPDLTPEQRQAAAQKLASLQQYAARSALPDTVQKGPGGPAGSSASGSLSAAATNAATNAATGAGTTASVTATPKPSPKAKTDKHYTFNFGGPPAASSDSAQSASTSGAAGSSSAASSADGNAVTPGLPTKSITLGDLPGKDDDDDDDDQASTRREVRQEVLASARDAADAVDAGDKQPSTVPAAIKPDAGTIKRVETSTIPSWVDRYAPIVRRRIEEVGKRSSEQNIAHLKQNGLHYAPYTLLALLPVCAFLLQMSFIGRHRGYVENLVAALHGHTFLFIALLVFVPLEAYSGTVASVWLLLAVVHMVWALSRIYGSRGIGLFMRLSVLAVTYGIAMVFATIFAVLISVLT